LKTKRAYVFEGLRGGVLLDHVFRADLMLVAPR
jgi:hypothetical protein